MLLDTGWSKALATAIIALFVPASPAAPAETVDSRTTSNLAVIPPLVAQAASPHPMTKLTKHFQSNQISEGDKEVLAGLQRRIKRAWLPPKDAASHWVTVRFKLHRDGTVSDVKVVRSSQMEIADKSALNAVRNAAPFPPLPSGHSGLVLEMDFDHNIAGKKSQIKIVPDAEQ